MAAKIVRTARTLELDRFDLKYSSGTLPPQFAVDTIERYARDVIPLVREGLG